MMLKVPKTCSCLMLRTPLKKTEKELSSTITFFCLIGVTYLILLLFILPCNHSHLNSLVLHDAWFIVDTLAYLSTLMLFLISMFRDPGYLRKPDGI